ncbi:MAG: protease SohB [Gammaproteobacteria bacterium]
MEFLTEIGLLMAQMLAVLITVGILVAGFLIIRARSTQEDHLQIKDLNQKFQHMGLVLKSAIMPGKKFKQELKRYKETEKSRAKSGGDKPRVFVLQFDGDIRATAVASLREEISAILQVANDQDEVVVVLESGGGIVHGYGLAASQLQRVRDHGIKLTVIVDKVAASGGYMMACVADNILAAPFAIIGSIGVIGQLPNFHRFLKNRDIDFEQITAGEYKRSLTIFGENTDKDRERFREELEETHQLFKTFVREHRPQVDIDKIATGEHWYASQALELKLVDVIKTSDDYLAEATAQADVYQVTYQRKKPVLEKLFGSTVSRLTTWYSSLRDY